MLSVIMLSVVAQYSKLLAGFKAPGANLINYFGVNLLLLFRKLDHWQAFVA